MKGVLLKDFYIAKSNILVTIVSLIVLGFGLSFLLGNKRTSDFSPGSFHHSGFYQYHKRRRLKME